MDKKSIIKMASETELPDLVLKNAKIINVFTEQAEQADVAIADGYIVGIGSYCGKKEVDLTGKIISPGFMDGHMHFESSLVTPYEYERAVLPRGTTAVMADPHEIANVAGKAGIDFMLDIAKELSMHAYLLLPSCVPSCPLEESGHCLESESLRPYYTDQQVLGLAEVMNSVGVYSGDEAILRKIEDAEAFGKHVDGHAPGLSGKNLCAYLASGVKTDHECTKAAEALEKLRLGQWIMIREGTAAKNMEALLPLCEPPYYQRCLFVTDDKHSEDLLQEGHMDAVIRKAVSLGVPVIRAIKMCTWNTAQCFGLKGYGAVAPGYHADLVIMDDLEQLAVQQVYINGKLVAENGQMCSFPQHTAWRHWQEKYPVLWKSFNLAPVNQEQLILPELKQKLRILCLHPHEILTSEAVEEITAAQREHNGIDALRDIIKIAVLERHHNTGHTGIGYLHGYGLKKGAVATSVAHDAHNLIVVGVNEADMSLAAERVRTLGGGLVVAANGNILAELPLPIGGLMSDLSIEEVDKRMQKLKAETAKLGVFKDLDPFMTLSFASLPVIPKLRLNTRGLINVELNQFVEVTL